MGCDIHAEIERKAQGEDYWRPVDWPTVECWQCKGTGVNQEWPGDRKNPNVGKPCRSCAVRPSAHDSYNLRRWIGEPGKVRERWLDARNYSRFAILADVRNGYGFAGCDTGDGYRPISAPRGLPAEKGVYWDDDDWRFGDHSFSWLTIDEILAYDWTQVTTRRGFVSKAEYASFKAHGTPDSWCGFTTVEKITNEQMDAFLLLKRPTRCYTPIAWEVTYAESFGLKDLAALKDLRESLDGELRLVFGFDS